MPKQQRLFSEEEPYWAISDDGLYRYIYGQRFRPTGPIALFIMLNPSDGTLDKPDPTMKKCKGFARRWHMAGFEIVNLFGWRASDPRELPKVADPVGPDNDAAILAAIHTQHRQIQIVAAWGNQPAPLVRARAAEVLQTLHGLYPSTARPVYAIRIGAGGDPLHPLYLPYSATLERLPWQSPESLATSTSASCAPKRQRS